LINNSLEDFLRIKKGSIKIQPVLTIACLFRCCCHRWDRTIVEGYWILRCPNWDAIILALPYINFYLRPLGVESWGLKKKRRAGSLFKKLLDYAGTKYSKS
jgi:hypothetical protein